MATLINDTPSPDVNKMSYDEFCIAAFGKDSDELLKKQTKNE